MVVRSTGSAYAITFATLVATVLLRWLLDPWLGDQLPLVTLFGAVALAVWLGGYRLAVLATVIGYLACDWLFITPRGQFHFNNPDHFIGFGAYLFSCAIIIGFGEVMWVARYQAQASLDQMQREMLRRQKAEEETQEAQGRAENILASITEAFYTLDREWRFTAFNDQAESYFGRPRSEMLGRVVWELFPQMRGSTFEEEYRKAMAEKVPVHFELLSPATQRWIELNAYPGTEGLSVFFRDITDRKQAEEAVARLAAIVSTSTDAIVSKTLEGIITSWNESAEQMFGYTAEEIIGQPILRLIPPELHPEEEQILARLKAGERVEHFETVRVTKDGQQLDVSLTISPIKDSAGKIIGASKIARDITEQKRAEKRERELIEEALAATVKFEAVFNQSGIFAGIIDMEGNLREVNDLAVHWCGYTREEVLDRPFWETPWWRGSEEVKARIRAALQQAAMGEVFREELRYWVADGTEYMVDFAMHPIRDQAGNIVFLHPTGIDITERKRAEEQLRASHDTFRQLVENSPFGIYVIDADFRVAQVGAGAQKVFENVRPLIGRDFAEVVRVIWPEPFASEAIGRFRHTLATGEPYHAPSTVERRHDIGEVEAYDWKIERITLPDGRFGVVCHFYDLSERQRFEAALRESEERLRLAIDAAEMFSWECDFQQQTIKWSENTARLLGCAPEALSADLAQAMFFVAPEDAERLAEEFAEFLRQGATNYIQEFRGREAGDQTQYWRAHALVLYDATGAPVRSVGITQNITGRKRAQVTERLLAEMRERNRLAQELHDTVAQALGYLNLKINVAYTSLATHEVEAAKAHLQELKGVINETYTDVREEIFYLRAKVLSDLSFMELLKQYVDKYRRFYNLEIHLLQEADPTLFDFSAEVTTQLIRTIQEALINIRKHARVNTATIRLGRTDGALCISIEDAGQGFDLAQSRSKSSSFGLQIMRERVESVGGHLEVDTAPGQGTRIVLRYGMRKL